MKYSNLNKREGELNSSQDSIIHQNSELHYRPFPPTTAWPERRQLFKCSAPNTNGRTNETMSPSRQLAPHMHTRTYALAHTYICPLKSRVFLVFGVRWRHSTRARTRRWFNLIQLFRVLRACALRQQPGGALNVCPHICRSHSVCIKWNISGRIGPVASAAGGSSKS